MGLHQLTGSQCVTIRPIRRDDQARLQASHARLSPQTQYRRFMVAKPRLSSSDLEYLADVDGRDHIAIVATVPGADGEQIIAVGRFIRLPAEPEVAEFAIVVADAWQNQGLGRELLTELVDAARAVGIRRLRASMLADNTAIHRLIERVAAGPVEHHRAGAVCEVEFPLGAPRPAARAA